MKDTIKLAIYITIVMLCTSNYSFAQFIMGGTAPNRFAVTDNAPANFNVEAVGIGAFTLINPPLSALHVNTNLLTTTPAFTSGEVFRTDAPGGVNTFWRLLRGGQEKGVLFNNFVNDNFQIQATQGNMLFNTAGPTPGTIRERMRITQSSGFGGVTNVTRVGISYGPTPIGVPVAMLHLGESQNIAQATRDWMDVGTFYNLQSDHMYVGLKDEGGIGDRMDAVINWGNNFIDQPTGHGPDFLRFIFNDGLISSSNDPRESENGLEVARFDPQLATTLAAPNYGMMGIGNFSPTGPNTAAADVVNAKLDIDGDLRIRTVTQNDALTQILAIDPTDKNRVHWVDAANFTGVGGVVTADNGVSTNLANNVQLGNDVGLTTAQLINDREIPMNNNNIMFNDNVNSTSSIGIGHPLGTSATSVGKLEVTNDTKVTAGVFNSVGNSTTTIQGVSGRSLNMGSGPATGVRGVSLGTAGNASAIGVSGASFSNSYINIGVNGQASNANQQSFAGNFDVIGSSSPQNYGVQVEVINGTNSSSVNFGTQLNVTNMGAVNYGIMSSASGATTNWAGWFNGNVFISGTFGPSDVVLKTNVESIGNAMDIIQELNPISFDFDNSIQPRLNLPNGKQYGLIAQEVESFLPEMVGTTTLPAEYDSLGNETDPSFEFKTLDYERFVPILIAGMKEQQQVINSLLTEMEGLKDCLRNANICTEGNRTMNNEPDNEVNAKSIELINTNSIILDQNLPNPFEEHTVINYNIPVEVAEAKLMFYDLNGRIIKELIIDERGESKLTVYGANLKTGVYTYSLIADGELITTKKMVKK